MTKDEARTAFREIIAGNSMSQTQQERMQAKFDMLIRCMGHREHDDDMLDYTARALDFTDCMIIRNMITPEQWNRFRELILDIIREHTGRLNAEKGA